MAVGGKNPLSRQIVKAMSVFGGVQVLSVLCSIVRIKLVAVLIGPVGIGLFGLYNSAIDMINNLSNLGIRSSSVRDISIEVERGSRQRVAEILAVVRRWTWALGIVAAFVTLVASPPLSRWTFGDSDHIWGFIALSVVVMFNALTNCEQSILQGTRRLRQLAQVGVYSVATGLLVSVPLFYFLREDSIVPSIIAYFAAGAFFSWRLRNKEYRDIAVNLSLQGVVTQGAGFVRLGFFMTLSVFLSLLASYIFIAYLNHTSGTTVVGYYQAGYTLVNRYAALIFMAIGTEYYPRLAKVCHSRWRTRLFVSQEINISLTVLVPVITLFVLLRQVAVDLLYSDDFRAIIPFISYASVGIVFQAISWCMAYVIIAKGRGITYLVTESLSSLSGILLNIVFYGYAGLDGLGVSYVVWYMLYTLIVGVVYFGKFKLTFHRSTVAMSVYAVVMAVASVVAMQAGLLWIAVVISVIAIVVGVIAMRRQLNPNRSLDRKMGKI